MLINIIVLNKYPEYKENKEKNRAYRNYYRIDDILKKGKECVIYIEYLSDKYNEDIKDLLMNNLVVTDVILEETPRQYKVVFKDINGTGERCIIDTLKSSLINKALIKVNGKYEWVIDYGIINGKAEDGKITELEILFWVGDFECTRTIKGEDLSNTEELFRNLKEIEKMIDSIESL